jgi:uncharacterized protein YjdB
MKKIYLFVFCCCLAAIAKAQPVVAIDPTTGGGFESGTTFVTNGWIAVNPATPVNQWQVGSAAGPFAGSRSAYISNNNGVTYAYSTSGNRTCHFYQDISFPPTAINITLSFRWKSTADTTFNRLLVYTAPTGSLFPAANVPVSPSTTVGAGEVLIWRQPTMSGSYLPATITLPASMAGATYRIVFTWQNGTSGAGLPASVDNISLNYCTMPGAITGQLRHCISQMVPLGNTVLGGAWSSSNTSVATINAVTGQMTGVGAGTTIISYANSCGTVTAVDTVIPYPAPIVGNDTVCLGTQSGLASVSLGGTWSSTYPTIASVTTGSGLLTGNNAGITTITYTMLPGCFVTQNVTVTPLPPAIAGPTEVCAGQSITLTNAIGGGTWHSSNPVGATAGLTSGVITGVTGDTATIIYTAPYGCMKSTVITIKPQPSAILGEMAKCKGATDTLYNTSPGGTWSSTSPGVATVGAVTGVITAVGTGVADIRYTLTSTGCYRSKAVTVFPAPNPIVTYDSWVQTFATDTTYLSYQWYNSIIGAIPGATTFQVGAVDSAYYYVEVTDASGCSGQSSQFLFNPRTVGVQGANIPVVSIHPNPATDMVYIDAAVPVRATITGIDGRMEIETVKARQINVSGLRSGIYFITLYSEEGQKLKLEKLFKL